VLSSPDLSSSSDDALNPKGNSFTGHLGQDGVVMEKDIDAGAGAAATPSDHVNRAGGPLPPAPKPVRSRRTAAPTAPRAPRVRKAPVTRAPALPTIAVTGARYGLGRALAARLAADPRVGEVVAIDDEAGERSGLSWRPVDVRDPSLVAVLAGCDAVVHAVVPDVLGPGAPSRGEAEAQLVQGARTVLTAAAAAGVGRVVLVTSAMVYGALPDNPVPLAEDGELRAVPEGQLLSGLLDIEDAASRAGTAHPGLQVTVVRPAVLVGPGVDSVFTRHFDAPLLLVVKDSTPHWQFCHVDDLASALHLAALGAVQGSVTVGCEGSLTQADVEQITGMRRIELPARLAYGTAERLHRLGITLAPSSELAYTAEAWVVPSTRLLAAGWTPRLTNAEALQGLVDDSGRRGPGRRIGRDATLGAAGATVAVLGTAAVVRQIRRQRRGGMGPG
jgi:nucleoside-diphosphate-sugar epimerase